MIERRRAGFSLIEIMITLVILSIALAAAGALFNDLVGDFRQQSKISETGMETTIGLQLLKKDIENGGYGLPWNMGGLGSYSEPNPLGGSPNPPRAFSVVNGGSAASDRLIVRALSVAGTDVSRKWTLLATGGAARSWGESREDLADAERVIVVRPGPSGGDSRTLNVVGGVYAPTFGVAKASYDPLTSVSTYLVYGLDNSAARMPFNRADYFIDTAIGSAPPICAPGTGTLVKGVVNQQSGLFDELPLLDCVLDMQVIFETTAGGILDDLGGFDADWIRQNIRHVYVYVLAHEGRRDERYRHDQDNVVVGDTAIAGAAMFRSVPIASTNSATTDQSHYRWKVYSLAVRPTTLR